MADTPNNGKLTLAEVNSAIREILEGGQKVVVGDREYQAAELKSLQKLRDEVAAAERAENGTNFIRICFGRVC